MMLLQYIGSQLVLDDDAPMGMGTLEPLTWCPWILNDWMLSFENCHGSFGKLFPEQPFKPLSLFSSSPRLSSLLLLFLPTGVNILIQISIQRHHPQFATRAH